MCRVEFNQWNEIELDPIINSLEIECIHCETNLTMQDMMSTVAQATQV